MSMKRIRKQQKSIICCIILLAIFATNAFAIEEAEVESVISTTSKEAVAGNVFIWFLCAVAFLKISQKIDSFLSALGLNVGKTGGSMLGELLIAGRAMGAVAKGAGAMIGNTLHGFASRGTSANQAAGLHYTGEQDGITKMATKIAGASAVASATESGAGIRSVLGGAALGASMRSGGRFASSVVGAVATGNYSSAGSIKGERASEALTSYLGYNTAEPAMQMNAVAQEQIGSIPDGGSVGLNGGAASRELNMAEFGEEPLQQSGQSQQSVPKSPPTFRDVEIGGGRITGFETAAEGGSERQFAMYHADQYLAPSEPYETIQTADGENWYKQYAQPVVKKTPYEDSEGRIKYDETIVEELPQIPKRKDRV